MYILKISRELKTGIATIIIISLFIWGYQFMKGQNLFDGSPRTYFARFDNVAGLNSASIVTINGYQVGKVVDITFNSDPNHKGQLIVEFGVDNDFKFSQNSVVKIYSSSLMGGKAIGLEPSYEGVDAVSGDFLKGLIETDFMSSLGESMSPIQAKIESVLVHTDSLMVSLNNVLDEKTQADLKETFSHLNASAKGLKSTLKSFDDIIEDNKESLSNTLSNFEKSSESIAQITDSIAAADLGGTIMELQNTIAKFNSILTVIDNGEGSIGKLLKDDALYINLENASKELEELLKEVKEHPKRFFNVSVFGKKDKGYQSEDNN